MWDWAKDEKVVKSFEIFSDFELRFLAFVCAWPVLQEIVFGAFGLYSGDKVFLMNLYNYLWWMAVGIILISKRSIFSIKKIHNFDFTSYNIPKINIKIIVYCALFSLCCLGFVWFYKDGFLEVVGSAKSASRSSVAFGFKDVVLQEVQYRLLLYYALNRLYGRTPAFVFGVLCFALSHQSSFYYPIAVIPVSIIFFLVMIGTGSLMSVIALHSLINLTFYISFK